MGISDLWFTVIVELHPTNSLLLPSSSYLTMSSSCSWSSVSPPPCIFYNAAVCCYNEKCHFSHSGPSLLVQVQQLRTELASLHDLFFSVPPPNLPAGVSSPPPSFEAIQVPPPPTVPVSIPTPTPTTSVSIPVTPIVLSRDTPPRRTSRARKPSKKLLQIDGFSEVSPTTLEYSEDLSTTFDYSDEGDISEVSKGENEKKSVESKSVVSSPNQLPGDEAYLAELAAFFDSTYCDCCHEPLKRGSRVFAIFTNDADYYFCSESNLKSMLSDEPLSVGVFDYD